MKYKCRRLLNIQDCCKQAEMSVIQLIFHQFSLKLVTCKKKKLSSRIALVKQSHKEFKQIRDISSRNSKIFFAPNQRDTAKF